MKRTLKKVNFFASGFRKKSDRWKVVFSVTIESSVFSLFLSDPIGLGCSTILSPEGSAQFAAQIFGLNNHLVWAKLRASILNTWIFLKQADKKIREGNL